MQCCPGGEVDRRRPPIEREIWHKKQPLEEIPLFLMAQVDKSPHSGW
jgi:hypothetical protein